MSEAQGAADMAVGLGLFFGALAVVGALASAATAYLYAMDGTHLLQTASGVAIGLAMLFGGLSIAAMHRYGE